MEKLCGPVKDPEYMTWLSPEQWAVCLHTNGPLLIVAGAGSGKTRALTHRAAYLVHRGVAPERILISTFTNRATREFKGRLYSLLGDSYCRLNIGTLHATGAKILRDYANVLGYSSRFPIYDTRDSYAVIRKVMKEQKIDKGYLTVGTIASAISRYKENLLTPNKAIDWAMNGEEEEWLLAHLYWHYQGILMAESAMDFGDLIMNTVNLLRYHPEVRAQIGMDYLLVDEFQDTDFAQFNMIQLLLDENKNLTAVGDIDQAIYSFRGADHQIMCDFKEHFPNAVIQPLGKNYRCSRNIVAAAASVIEQNKNRIVHELSTDNAPGEPIVYMPVADEYEEALQIVNRIRAAQHVLGVSLNEIAVLYRTNIQSQPIEEALLNARIPYHVIGLRFFERREVLDVMSYLRVIYNPDDSGAWRDLLTKPKGKISKTAMDAIEEYSSINGITLSEAIANFEKVSITSKQKVALTTLLTRISEYREKLGKVTLPELTYSIMIWGEIKAYYQTLETEEQMRKGSSALDNLSHLVQMTGVYPNPAAESLPEFLQYASLMTDVNDEQTEGVQLLTLHAAKGTEYTVVTLAGVEEDILPHWRAKNDPTDSEAAIEEERRLFYVGMTRAKELLYITSVRYRKVFGKSQVCCPSRFLNDLPSNLMVRWNG